MNESRLLLGSSSEERDSALRQVSLWDGASVVARARGAALRRPPRSPYARWLHRHIETALADGTRCTGDLNAPLEPQAMKLCRLLHHCAIPIAEPPTAASLHLDGKKVERKASKIAGVKDLDDLVRHVLCRLFSNLDVRLSKASPEERERIVKQIADALDHVGDDVREQVMRIARLDDLSLEALARTGGLTALGVGLAGVIGSAGFAAYTTLNATIASVSGLVGLTLPFSAYVIAASLLAFATNPYVLLAAVGGGGVWLVRSANRRMQAGLLPLLVAFAVVKAEGAAGPRSRSRDLARHLAGRYQEFLDGDPQRRAQLLSAFPAFRDPKGSRFAG